LSFAFFKVVKGFCIFSFPIFIWKVQKILLPQAADKNCTKILPEKTAFSGKILIQFSPRNMRGGLFRPSK